MRFKPGQSGNPGGRRATPSEVKQLLGSVSYEAVERLIAIMRGKDPREARLAAEALLDRHLGKPAISMNVTSARLGAVQEEFAAAAAGLLERAITEEEKRVSADTETVAVGVDGIRNENDSAAVDADVLGASAENVRAMSGGAEP